MLEEYLAMRRATWPPERGSWDVTAPDPASFDPPRGAFLLVSDDDGAEVGCGGVRLLGAGSAGPGPRAEVKHLYLRSEVRGQGWGKALLAALEDQARALGATTVVLDTNDTLPVAQGLYRAAGYREVERYNDNPHATHWYAKPLDA